MNPPTLTPIPSPAPAPRYPRTRQARAAAAWLVCGWLASLWPASAAVIIDLGAAQNVSILGGSTVTNTGPTIVNGNVGVSPGNSVTGFPPGTVVNGGVHINDALAVQAHASAVTAFGVLAGETYLPGNDLTGQDLGGLTLLPGVFHFNTSAQLTGLLTLDTGGDPNAAFHFQIGTTLTTAMAAQVLLLNGSSANIFWQIGTSAILGTGTLFNGNILADQSITLTTGATLDGRALAINGAVTMDTNNIQGPVAALALGSFWKGGASNLWSGANWSPDATGLTSSTLAPAANVVFSVTGLPAANQATVLDVDATISSLTVNDPVAVTISGTHLLSIAGAGAVRGITINALAGLTTINSDLVLSGLSQVMTVNNAAGLVINGAVGGTIGLTKAGVGQLTLAGANHYAGATTILQGTLLAGAANVIPARSAVLVNAGSVFNLAGHAQSVGSIADGPLGGGAIPLGAASLVTGNDGTSTLFSGVISGPGSVQKVGAGTWELTGPNTFTGLATVSAGALAVNGAIGGNALVAGGILRGIGNIAGNVVNRAVVNPGLVSAPGTLHIGGNFSQSPAGTLRIRLGSPFNYDRLTIGGAASLGGALSLSYVNGFNAQPGDVFTIATAAGGVSGKFATFNNPHATSTLLTLGVVYEPNRVLLEFVQGSLVATLPELHGNELAVAEALDDLPAGNNIIRELNTLPLSSLSDALSLLSAEDFAAIFTSGLAISQVQVGNLERRLGEVRQGASGFSDSGFAVSDSHGAQNYDGKSVEGLEGKSGKELDAPLAESRQRWGFFISGTGEWGDVESSDSARGSSFTTGGVSVGGDYRVNDHVVVGAALGYANTSSDLSRGGNLDIDSGKGSLYATVYDHGFYVNGVVGGGYGSIDTKRRTLGGFAYGDTNATDFNALLGTGYEHHLGGLTVGPVASIQYATVGIDSFTERGALGAMRIDAQSQDSLKSAVGLRAAFTKKLGRVIFTPEVRAQWQHEYLTSESSVDGGFGSGRSFTVRGPRIGRDGLLLDVGASAQVTSGLAIFAYYTTEVGRENYQVQSVNGGVRVSF